jgi:hypothetical protein
MTRQYIYYLLITLFFISCVDVDLGDSLGDSPQTVKVLTTTCFTIEDEVDNSLIDSVFVRINVMRPSGVPLSHSGYTNNSGEVCFTYEGQIIGFFSQKKGYVYYGCHYVVPQSTTIIMQPYALLNVKLKNVDPVGENDSFYFTYWGIDCSGGQTLYFFDSVVDTVFTKPLHPGDSELRWRSMIDGVYSEYTEKSINVNPRDTVFIDIEY